MLNLDYDIKLYLEEIIHILLSYVQAPQFSRDVKYWALVCMSSTINTAQKKIQPFMQMLLEQFHNIIVNQAGEQQNVKGQALMCAGRLASACGKDNFPQQAIEVFTNFGLECLKQEKNKLELKETAISYFSDLACLIKEDMAPIFETVINEILKTMNADDEYNEEKGEKKNAGGFSLDSDSEEGDDVIGVNVDINQLDEKASAVNALGVICMNAPKLCQGRMKDILEAQEHLHFYFHENIKYHVCLAYIQIATGMMRLNGVMNSDDKFEWTKGDPTGSPLPHDVLAFLDRIVFPYFFSLFEKEDNKEVIERALENLREIAEDFGPGAYVN